MHCHSAYKITYNIFINLVHRVLEQIAEQVVKVKNNHKLIRIVKMLDYISLPTVK